MHFDIIDLRLFTHIAEAGNLTKGADRAALSPAAASARLKALEAQLGQRLFYRDSRGVTLTAAGETLLRHARVILRQVEHVRTDFSADPTTAAGHFRLFANTTAINEILPKVLADFLGERPHVAVHIEERNTHDVVRSILDSSADVGVVAGVVTTEGLESRCFSTDRLVLVTPPRHPLAGLTVAAFSETMGYPHVGLRGSTLQEFLVQKARLAERRLDMRILMGSFESMCCMIESGVGIGVLPESAALRHSQHAKLRVIQLSDEWSIRERRVLYRELDALPACARAFVNLLCK
ncbi:LysR substrate-binding domain-containing protein [Candidimonas nitroreducens]|uniref:LysR family transcriptional regulator n=1 Tax=Candidimonas nitroreducens TaxID=683354 RepID=A0A225MRP6_9BURK|nr:LysR substrate-binding domain-containing protein [Candidimonas nitroreducens]OWT63946.1 LysR family transcriptional regulator [Candidimonas nitroreducens]